MITLFFKWILWTLLLQFCTAETPRIILSNVTVPVGHDAVLSCIIENLGPYKVAWIRPDTRTILTIQQHVITREKRIKITTFKGQRWNLHIDDVKESDRGYYICQINTETMMSQAAYLEVVDSNKPVDTNTTKLDETNDKKEKKEKRPDEDSSTKYCLPAYTTISFCFIFVVASALMYKVLS